MISCISLSFRDYQAFKMQIQIGPQLYPANNYRQSSQDLSLTVSQPVPNTARLSNRNMSHVHAETHSICLASAPCKICSDSNMCRFISLYLLLISPNNPPASATLVEQRILPFFPTRGWPLLTETSLGETYHT